MAGGSFWHPVVNCSPKGVQVISYSIFMVKDHETFDVVSERV